MCHQASGLTVKSGGIEKIEEKSRKTEPGKIESEKIERAIIERAKIERDHLKSKQKSSKTLESEIKTVAARRSNYKRVRSKSLASRGNSERKKLNENSNTDKLVDSRSRQVSYEKIVVSSKSSDSGRDSNTSDRLAQDFLKKIFNKNMTF